MAKEKSSKANKNDIVDNNIVGFEDDEENLEDLAHLGQDIDLPGEAALELAYLDENPEEAERARLLDKEESAKAESKDKALLEQLLGSVGGEDNILLKTLRGMQEELTELRSKVGGLEILKKKKFKPKYRVEDVLSEKKVAVVVLRDFNIRHGKKRYQHNPSPHEIMLPKFIADRLRRQGAVEYPDLAY